MLHEVAAGAGLVVVVADARLEVNGSRVAVVAELATVTMRVVLR